MSRWVTARNTAKQNRMKLAEVVGTVVATQKDDGLTGVRLLLIRPREALDTSEDLYLVAADGLGSHAGDTVVYVRAREASLAIPGRVIPSDCSIVARVEHPGSMKRPEA